MYNYGPELLEQLRRNRRVRVFAIAAVCLGVLWVGLWVVFQILVMRTGLFHG